MKSIERPGGWFKLSAAYYLDPKILRVSGGAELLFVRMLALCSATASGGRVSGEQLLFLGRGIRSVRATIDELIEADLIMNVLQTQRYRSGNAEVSQGDRSGNAEVSQTERSGIAEVSQEYCIKAYSKWNAFNGAPAEETAAQPAKNPQRWLMEEARAQGARARGPAYGETERKTERATPRPATPDGRGVAARTAPRAPDGATQHAPEDQVQKQNATPPGEADDEPDSLTGLEHLSGPELAKAALNRGKANSKYVTGKDHPVAPKRWTADKGRSDEPPSQFAEAMNALTGMATNPNGNGEVE